MKTWSAVYVDAGYLRRLWFEAENAEEARAFAAKHGAGLEGEANWREPEPMPAAYDAKTTRRLLGGISRSSLYRMLMRGDLARLPDTRRVLITRTSIQQHCR